jgi:hypothetical protein
MQKAQRTKKSILLRPPKKNPRALSAAHVRVALALTSGGRRHGAVGRAARRGAAALRSRRRDPPRSALVQARAPAPPLQRRACCVPVASVNCASRGRRFVGALAARVVAASAAECAPCAEGVRCCVRCRVGPSRARSWGGARGRSCTRWRRSSRRSLPSSSSVTRASWCVHAASASGPACLALTPRWRVAAHRS